MTVDEMIETYAQLIIHHGAAVQPGQDVYIAGEPIHRHFLNLLVKVAYQAGARYVVLDLIDPMQQRLRLLHSKEESYLDYIPKFIPFKYDQMIPEKAAVIRILGSEDPDLLRDLDPEKMNRAQLALRKSLKNYYKEGIGHSKVAWTIAAAATPLWGKKVFPNLSPEEAERALWKEILHICRADQPDCLEIWKRHNALLQKRAKAVTEMEIETLHFVGPGTDLKVGLSKKARFRGGSDKGPRGADFEPNLPTEEIFTTPDCRKTEGFCRATRPFLINGVMIRGLKLTFKAGEIISFEAEEGASTFGAYINSDPGAKKLGEVALVGIDSPIYQTGHIFEEILFDENAACHIAVGFAYHFCIDGSEEMSEEALELVGCNTSSVHTDMMISSEEVDVTAETYSGKKILLIKKGKWVDGSFA